MRGQPTRIKRPPHPPSPSPQNPKRLLPTPRAPPNDSDTQPCQPPTPTAPLRARSWCRRDRDDSPRPASPASQPPATWSAPAAGHDPTAGSTLALSKRARAAEGSPLRREPGRSGDSAGNAFVGDKGGSGQAERGDATPATAASELSARARRLADAHASPAPAPPAPAAPRSFAESASRLISNQALRPLTQRVTAAGGSGGKEGFVTCVDDADAREGGPQTERVRRAREALIRGEGADAEWEVPGRRAEAEDN